MEVVLGRGRSVALTISLSSSFSRDFSPCVASSFASRLFEGLFSLILFSFFLLKISNIPDSEEEKSVRMNSLSREKDYCIIRFKKKKIYATRVTVRSILARRVVIKEIKDLVTLSFYSARRSRD